MIEINDFPIMVTVKIKTERDTACMHTQTVTFTYVPPFGKIRIKNTPGSTRVKEGC